MKKCLLILLILFISISFLFISYNLKSLQIQGLFKSVLEEQEHHSPPSVVIEPGSGVETASYIVFHDDEGWIYAKNGDTGEIEFSGTDADEVINWALSSLNPGRTWQETVYIKGNFTTNSPIIVYNFTHLILDGRVYLEDGSDCNILQNAHPSTYDIAVTIEGGEWHGNHEGQAKGHGIYWEHSTQPGGIKTFKTVTFKDMTIVECLQDGIHIDAEGSSTSEFVIEDVVSKWHMDDGIHLYHCADWKMEGGMPFDGAGYGIHIEASGFASISNSYINDGVLIEGVDHGGWIAGVQLITMTNCELDCGAHHGIQLKGVQYSTFSNLVFHIIDDGASDYDGIRLETIGDNPESPWDTSCNNTFTNINFGYSSGTRQWKYGINEVDANQDYNQYCNINARNVATMGFNINGANSHVSSSWNGTSWIDYYP